MYIRKNTKLSTEHEASKKQIANLQAAQVASSAPTPCQRAPASVENSTLQTTTPRTWQKKKKHRARAESEERGQDTEGDDPDGKQSITLAAFDKQSFVKFRAQNNPANHSPRYFL